MAETVKLELLSAEDAARQAAITETPNGIRYAIFGQMGSAHTTPAEIERLVGTVPATLAPALKGFRYIFVPLALSAARMEGDESTPFPVTDRTLIAPVYTPSLTDKAVCHRNASVDGNETVFLSSRLHNESFALVFEFFINVAHNFTDTAGVPQSFADLLWKQATANVRGETSIDAWEERAAALSITTTELDARTRSAATRNTVNEHSRNQYFAAAFADALAIYQLAIHQNFDYTDLREREYPLLAAPALAERLRAIHKLFPPNDGYQFQILYRRRA